MRKGFTLIELMIVVAIIAIIAAIAIPSLLRSRIAANEVSAVGGMKQLTAHEASLRQTDGDGNGIKDYWTIDIAGFYALEDVNLNPLKYIDVQMAKADDNALQGIYTWAPSAVGAATAKSGYLYMAITTDENAAVYASDTSPLDGIANPYNNVSKFGFCAFPSVYGREGVRVFIVNEEGVVYAVDNGEDAATQKGETSTLDGAAEAWPGTDPTAVAAGGGRFWGVTD